MPIIENVSNYPRPPALEKCKGNVEIFITSTTKVECNNYYRVLETFHAPTIYISKNYFANNIIDYKNTKSSYCEWKGIASYINLINREENITIYNAGWYYKNPKEAYQEIKGYISLYPEKVRSCSINGEFVKSQDGGYYGGWITSRVKGPFKGDPKHPEII